MLHKNKICESDIGRAVAEWLESRGHEVFHEVRPFPDGHRADLVAIKNERITVVECKTSFSLAVIRQAWAWRREYVHRVYVATLDTICKNQHFAGDMCNRLGIGWLVADIDLWSDRAASVREVVRPDTIRFDARWHTAPQMLDVIRHFRDAMRNALNEDQKNGVPGGSAGGGYSTPFSRTARCVAAIVARHGGIKMTELIRDPNFTHHYKDDRIARGCITKWALRGKIPGVRIERTDSESILWPTDTEIH